MRESALEALLVNLVRRSGGVAIKLMPTVAGVPDRLVLWPRGQAQLVELKADGEQVSVAQRVWHNRAAALGHPVVVVTGATELRSWVAQNAMMG